MRRVWLAHLILLLPPLAANLLHLPHPWASALVISIVLLWVTEALPLAATALLVPVLGVGYGILEPKTAFSAFGDGIIFLMLGAFLISHAAERYGWAKRLALLVMAIPRESLTVGRLSVLIGAVSFVLSMWISNTATTALFVPVILGIEGVLRDHMSEKTALRITQRLLFSCVLSASVGGMATPVGSPPNLIALGVLSERGVQIGFLEWMMIGVPIAVTLFVLAQVALGWLLFERTMQIPRGVHTVLRSQLSALGRVRAEELCVAAAFSVTVILWILPDFVGLLSPDGELVRHLRERLSLGTSAILGALLLFLLPAASGERILSSKDLVHVPWGTLLLFGGGLTLAKVFEAGHLSAGVASVLPISEVSFGVLLLVLLVSVGLSELASNTASVAVLAPLIVAAADVSGASTERTLLLAATFGASCGFMLPVSTPPNAIVFGTGRIPLPLMMKIGAVFDALCLLTIASAMMLF